MGEAEFWSLTPRQIDCGFVAAGQRLERAYNDRMSLAWHIAALPRTKKFPKLKSLLQKQRAKPEQQSWQQQVDIAKKWTALLGGTIKGKAH